MREVLIDLTEYEEMSFDPLPPGTYILEVDVTGKETVERGREKNTPYMRLRFRVVEPQEYAGKLVFHNLILSGPGVRLTGQLLSALGYEVRKGMTFRLPLYDIAGKRVGAHIGHEEYQGQIRNRIRAFIPVDEVEALEQAG